MHDPRCYMNYDCYKGWQHSAPGNPNRFCRGERPAAVLLSLGPLVPSRSNRFAAHGDEPSPPRFKGRPLIARAAALYALVATCVSSGQAASLPSEWQREQHFEASAPGIVKFSLPLATLDAARPALEDLRL